MMGGKRGSRRLPRRDALRYGVGAAALVWTTPAIRRIQVTDADGSPPPGSSTSPTTVPEPTTHTLDGEFDTYEDGWGSSCGGLDFDFTGDLGSPGTGTVTVHTCGQPAGGDVYTLSGTFLLEALDGTVSGTARGELTNAGSFIFPFHLDIEITNGTGSFEGALGTAVFDGTAEFVGTPTSPVTQVEGTFAGTFTAP